jgi:hypothetical protein
MFEAAASPRGEVVSVRAGAHQVEDLGAGGFGLHLGILFRGVNYHLNVQQTNSGHI